MSGGRKLPAKRVLVTGGTGFIGVNLCRRLVADGVEVTVLARRGAVQTAGLPDGARVERGDVRDEMRVREVLSAALPDVVMHLASTPFNPPGTTDREHEDVIVGGTAAVLDAIGGRDVRLVHVGSAAEYGAGSGLREDHPLRPTTALGRAKASAWRLVHEACGRGLDAVILRLFTPYGPWDRPGRLIIHTALRALAGGPIPISDGRQRRDLVFVEDVVSALLLAAERPRARGETLNICSGRSVSVREVVDLVLAELGSAAEVVTSALPTRPDEIWDLSGDNTAAACALGWRPATDLRTGIARTCAWVVDERVRLSASMEAVRA